MDPELCELEVKAALLRQAFPPAEGWKSSVHVDAFERGLEGEHPAGFRERAAAAFDELSRLGAEIGPDEFYGQADIVARHPSRGTFVVEAAGAGGRPPEQSVHAALGQLVSSMRIWSDELAYGLAVPAGPEWRRQLMRLPWQVREKLRVHLYLVGPDRLERFLPGETVPE